MIGHYLKIAWRNILKYKTQSIISVLGLAIGFTAFSFTLSWIRYEMGYDSHNPDADRIYRVLKVNKKEVGGVQHFLPEPLANYLVDNYPEIEAATAVRLHTTDYEIGDKVRIPKCRHLVTDTSFFHVFYPETHVSYPPELPGDALILPQHSANILDIRQGDVGTYSDSLGGTLLDIVPDFPVTRTNVPFDVMGVRRMLKSGEQDCSWCRYFYSVYIRVHKNVDIASLAAKLDSIEVEDSMQGVMSCRLVSLRKVHYQYPQEKAKITFNHLKIFAGVALLVIFCALFNYLMLFVNRLKLRNRELALRKVNGASNAQLTSLLLCETGLIVLLSLFIGVVITEILYPLFVRLSEIEANESFFVQEIILYAVGFLSLSLIIALIPVGLFMKRNIRQNSQPDTNCFYGIKNGFTVASLALQLIISVMLIFCTVVFLYQFRHLNHSEIGFNRYRVSSFNSEVDLSKDEIKKIPGVEDVIYFDGEFLPRRVLPSFSHELETGEKIDMERFNIYEPSFFDFFSIRIVEGRNFHYGEKNVCLINKTAQKRLGFDDPIGQVIDNMTIIGVIPDLYIDSPLLPVQPAAYRLKEELVKETVLLKASGEIEHHKSEPIPLTSASSFSALKYPSFAYRYFPGQRLSTEKAINDLVRKNGGSTGYYYNMEDVYNEYTQSERYLLILLSIMTGVAILIAVFGIYSMITLSCNQRRKEIAIRKVNGARAKEILAMFFKQYAFITVLSCIIAFPVGALIMQRWLEQYPRRIVLEWWLFAGVFLLVALIVFGSILFRVLKAAGENPAEVVKSE
ncbi:MAG TPA: hypothetical protein DDZ78_09225 [Porphyromonadaceae bacterium]|nr:hypothetical protein [Porphyromonadaceae bacterium]